MLFRSVRVKGKAKAEPEPEPEPSATPQVNPFADSVPFPESQIDSSYERMEEVSLESLLSEGRERPATISGNVAIPIDTDEVEELDAAALVPAEATPSPEVAVTEVSDAVASDLDEKVRLLEAQIDSIRAEHREELESILRYLDALRARVRDRLDS